MNCAIKTSKTMKGFMFCNRWGMKLIKSNPTQSKRPAARLASGAALAGNLLALLMLATPVPAPGQIFVVTENGFAGDGQLGEYNLDGTPVNASLIPYGGLWLPNQIAVSGSDLFISDNNHNTIGKYTTSGATVNASLITGFNGNIVVSGSDLFVVNSVTGIVGEYTTSGAPVNPALITGLNNPQGLVLLGSDLFVLNYGSGTVGEYTTSGATVNASLITGLGLSTALAGSGSYLFVANESGTIGEYTTSGATVNASLITGLGIRDFTCMEVYGSELLVTDRNSIFEYTLGATPGTVTSSDTSFITGLYESNGFAVESVPEPGTLSLLAGGLIALFSVKRRRA